MTFSFPCLPLFVQTSKISTITNSPAQTDATDRLSQRFTARTSRAAF